MHKMIFLVTTHIERGMAGIGFQLGHGLGDSAERGLGSHLETLGDFIGGQIGVLTPFVAGLLVWATAAGWRTATAAGNSDHDSSNFRETLPFLLWPTLLPLACFAAASWFSASEVNWPAPAYLTGFALLGAMLWRHTTQTPRRMRLLVTTAVLFATVLSAYIHIEAAWPLIRYEGGPFAKVRDRSELIEWAQQLRETHAAPDAQVLASSYQLASLLAFYLPQQPLTDAPFERGSGSAYREWRPLACGAGHAWYFSDRAKPPPDGLFESFEPAGTYIEQRKGTPVGTINAYFGKPRAMADCIESEPIASRKMSVN